MQQEQYRPDIDGLRAIAVLQVVVFHAFPSYAPGGFAGVDIFFVISGFLISKIIIAQINDGTFSFGEFYARRIRRIFPALALVLFAVVTIGWLVLLPEEYRQLLRHVFSSAAFLQNFTLWLEAGYFDTASDLKPLLHLWSLGVEEQFYIIWPALLVIFSLRTKGIATLLIAIGLLSFSLNIVFINSYPTATFFLPFTRFWELMLGAALVFMPTLTRAAGIASATGLVLMAVSAFALNANIRYSGYLALLPTIGAALAIAAGPQATCNRLFLSNRWAVLTGLISYPLYLWHWPLLSFARIINAQMSADANRLTRVFILGLSFALAYATYRWVELRIRSTRPPKFVMGLSASILSVCAVAFVLAQPFAFMGSRSSTVFNWESVRWNTPGCLERFQMVMSPSPFCVTPHLEESPTVMLIGDSHSNHWMPGIVAQSPSLPILQMGGGACPYIENVDNFSFLDDLPHQQLCRKAMARIFGLVRSLPTLRTVILTSHSTDQVPGPAYGDLKAEPTRILKAEFSPASSNVEIYEEGLRRTLRLLTELHKKIIIILDVPDLGFDPKSCLRLRPIDVLKNVRADCRVARGLVEARQRPSRSLIKRVAQEFEGIEIIDPNAFFCDARWCYGIKNGLVLYRNEDHLTVAGSELAWKSIRPQPLTR